MKKILLFALIVCSVCFTACSKRNDIQENIESTSVEENKNSNDGSKNIEKKKRYLVSIIGETGDSALFVEFKDESSYTFFSPYGGYLWSSSDYKTNGDAISFSVMKEETPFNMKELNNLFSSKNADGHVDFVYDGNFSTFNLTGGYRNGNVGLFPDDSKPTPEGTVCMLGNTKVIKKSGCLVPVENLKVRKEPSTKAETGVIDYGFELLCLTEEEYMGTEMLNKDYAKKFERYDSSLISPVLLAGMKKNYSAVTVDSQTIDGITAPWYRISFTDNDEGGNRYYWIFGGYIKELDNPDTKEYEQLFFDAAVKNGYLIPQAEINEKKQNAVNQSKTVLEYAEPLYKLRSVIENKHDRTEEKPKYYTIYYYNENCTYSTVVELVNNDLLASSKLKTGMKKQAVIELLGQPVESTAETIEYNTFEYTQGYGYILTFTIENNTVSKIKIYFEK